MRLHPWYNEIDPMLTLQVRHHDASVHVNVKLKRFIANWSAAQQKFIGGIADRFQDWHPIGPKNFSVIPALSLDDVRCRCQIFGGAGSIILAPDTLYLSFSNVRRRDQPEVTETVRRSLDWLYAALGEHGRDWLSFNTFANVQAVNGAAADAYLSQFIREDIDSIMQSESGVKYLPSTRMMCSDESGRWMLQRVVEKSISIKNGVFVDTMIRIQSPDPTDFDNHMDLITRLDRLADRIVSLEHGDS